MAKKKATFFVVLAVTLVLAWLAFFGLHIGSLNIMGASEMRFGIDIRGGVDAAFAPKDLDRMPTETELDAARDIFETRLNQQNILDRDVTIDKEAGYIFVRFPWKTGETEFNPDKAISELGSTAHLTFRDPDGNVVLEGKYVDSTTWGQDSQNIGFVVHLKLKPEGRQMFMDATGRLVGRQISIYMDETLISSPVVNQQIDSEDCQITGIGSAEEAKLLSNQINSGTLPFSMTAEHYSAISPSLGNDALEVMVIAGIVSFLLICLALMLYYRLSGVVAVIALLLQVAGQLLMLTWPQITVTLPGIAGIILAIGMGVDANIIVSERIREEIRSGKTIENAVTYGFKRAFSSVFDGNITVLIVSLVMMVFGSGAILSFAYTLLFGIIMNFVAGVVATRLMTQSLVQFPRLRKTSCFLSRRMLAKKKDKVFPFYRKKGLFFGISMAVMAIGVVMMLINGIHLDIQFKGGTIIKYDMSEEVELNPDAAASAVEQALDGRLITAQITTDYITQRKKLVLNMASSDAFDSEELEVVTAALMAAYPVQAFELSEVNNVAPFFSQKFLRNGITAIVLSAVLIVAYMWFSFRKIHGLSAGVMALVALLHDVLVVFFTFIVFRIPIGDNFIAVAMTILGYSINDTIVIFDRIRENMQHEKGAPLEDLVDKSISQSFTRSLYTSLAVVVCLGVVYIFAAGNGLDAIKDFALPMCIGTVSGCYSTVCIAEPAWVMWQKFKQRRKNEKGGAAGKAATETGK